MSEKSVVRGKRRSLSSLVDLIVHTDPVGIIGILLSIALSVALDVTGVATGVESLLAGLLGITLSLVLDSIVRAERRFRIRSMLEGVPWFSESFFKLAERTTDIAREFPDSQIVLEAKQRYEVLQDDLDDLRRGRIIRGGNDYEHLLMGMRECSTLVEAATNMLPRGNGAEPTSWWQSDIGRHYWQLNVEAARRGVRITRIITYAEMTAEIADLVAKQRAAGIEIGLLRRGSVDPALHLNYAMFDGGGAWEARMNAHGLIVANIYTINSHDVGRIRGVFKACRIVADFSSSPRELLAD